MVGLADALTGAHEIQEVSCELGPETAALHRLLFAFARRVLGGPADLDQWLRAWKAARFAPEAVDRYLGAWRHRLDLFDEKRPFFQHEAGVDLAARGAEASPARRLLLDRCDYGAAASLYALRGAMPPITPARAAHALIAFHAFSQGGAVSDGSDVAAPLATAAVVTATGRTLYETLLLNLVPGPVTEGDAPAWERGPIQPSKIPRAPCGILDRLTWQSRAVGLALDAYGTVAAAGYGIGERMPVDALRDEPAVAWRQKKKDEWAPVKIDLEKLAWRDADAWFGVSDSTRCPGVVTHVRQVGAAIGRAVVPFMVTGIAWDQKAILTTRQGTLPISTGLLSQEAALATVLAALQRADAIGAALGVALRAGTNSALGNADPSTVKARSNALKATAGSRYWGALDGPFQRLLLEAEHGSARDGAAAFERLAEQTARETVREAMTFGAGMTIGALRGGATAASVFDAKVRRSLDQEETK